MPATVAHVFTNNVPNATGTVTYFDFAAPGSTNTVPATSIVRPTDWNETHLVTLAPTGAEMLGGFSNGGNVSFGTNPSGFITASAPSGGAGGGVANAAGTQTGTSGTIVFSNSNNITFGMSNSSVITASASFNQTVQPAVQSVNGSSGAISLNVGSSLSASTNGSSITFGLASNITTALQSTGNYLTTAAQSNHSHNFATTTTGGANIVVGTTNSNGATIGVPAYLTTAMQSNAVTLSNINVSAGTTSNLLSAITFANGNGVSFGLDAGTLTCSVAAAGGAQTGISGLQVSNATFTSGTVTFQNANGISFGSSGANGISASYTVPTQTTQSGVTTAGANIGLSGTLNQNGLSLSATVAAQSVQTQNMVSVLGSTGNISFANGNGVTFGGNASTITASHNGLTSQSNQNVTAANGGFAFQTLSFSNLNGISFGTSAGSAITASHNGITSQTNQTGGLYVTANSTQLSSTGNIDYRSLSFAGAGIASVGVSNGVVLVSVPSGGGAGDGVNIVQAGTAGTTGTTYSASTGTVRINGGNNITVSQNGSNDIVISAAQGGIAAGTQTATSGTLVFANSNGVTFGMSGSSQITASVNAGGGAAATISQWEPYPPIGGGVAFSTMGQNTIYLQRLNPPVNVAFANVERRMSGSFVSSTNSQSCRHTYDYGLYSRGTGASTSIYSQIGSSQLVFMASISSNVSAGITISQGAGSFTSTSAGTEIMSLVSGYKHLYMGYADTLTAGGEYAWAMRMSSATTVGTNALRIGVQELSVINNLTIGKVYATTALASNASFVGYFAQGVYSATSSNLPSTIALSGLTNAVSQQRMYLQFDN